MRIAVWHNLPSGGGKRALYNHVRGLVARGHTVESWCPSTADQSYLPLSDLAPEHVRPLNGRLTTANHRLTGLRALYRGPLELINALNEHCRRCAEEINQGGFDILFANTSLLLRSGPIGRYVKIPKVIYLQEPNRVLYEALPRLAWVSNAPNGKPWWTPTRVKRKITDWINLEALRLQAREELENAQAYDAILANSYFSRESILRAYGLDAKVCYLGVDTNLFRPLGRARERFIVGLGAFVRSKGIELAIESVSRLSVQLPLVWISNVTDASHMDEMKSLAKSLKVDLQVRIEVSDSELIDLLNRASLMLSTAHLEPFGLAPLEANACGTPVVAIAEGGMRETVTHGLNGLVVSCDPKQIAEAMNTLLNDPVLARLYGERAAEYVRREWSLERSVERLEDFLLKYAKFQPVSRVAVAAK